MAVNPRRICLGSSSEEVLGALELDPGNAGDVMLYRFMLVPTSPTNSYQPS
jgi:hypothetical protein